MKAVRICVSGLVQGVFFRAQAKEKADELGLTGFVKNLNEGGVEIYAEGPEDKLKALEQWCWKGPTKAKVTAVTVTEDQVKHLSSFDVWY